jgi:hypothetical protein
VTYEDSRQQIAGDSNLGIPKTVSMFKHAVGESYMDAIKIFQSPVRLASQEWDTSITAGAQFLQYELPAAFAANPTFHKLLLQMYVFYKPDIKITVQINATPQHMGLLRLWYDPFTQYTQTLLPRTSYEGKPLPKRPTIYTTSGQPHKDIQACDSSPTDLHIRFEHPQSCLTTNSIDPISNMGRIGVMVINPLEASATSSTVVTVQMWMQFVSCEVAVPIWDHVPQIPTAAELQGDTAGVDDSPIIDNPDMSGFVDVPTSEGIDSYGPPPSNASKSWWARGLGVLGGIAGTVWNAMTGNWGGAAAMGTKTAIDAMGLFMDKPSDPLRAVHNMIFPITPLAHTQGINGAVRLDAAPIGGYTDIDFTSSDPSEQKFSNLMKIPMMFNQFNWASTDAPGTLLFNIPVTPAVCHYEDAPVNINYSDGTPGQGTGRYITPTYLSKYSSLFKFWSGSIKYHFQFVTTSIHTGKVICTFIPNNYANRMDQTLVQTTCASTVEFDVAGEKNFEFTPGWVSAIPRKTWTDWSIVDYSALDDTSILGWLEVRVTGRLTTTNAVPGTVHCNVWISAGDDFFCETLLHDPFQYIAGDTINTLVAPPPPPDAAELQGDTNPEYAFDEQTSKINNMSSINPSQMTNQAVGDVRDPCRRANLLGLFRIPLITAEQNVEAADNVMYYGQINFWNNPFYTGAASQTGSITTSTIVDIGDWKVNPDQNFLASVGTGFVFYSGALDWTIIPYSPMTNKKLSVRYHPGVDNVNDTPLIRGGFYHHTAYPVHTTILGQQNAIQVTTPYTSNYNQLAITSSLDYSESVYSSGYLTVEVTASDVSDLPVINDIPQLYVEVFKTLGDDGRFSWAVSPAEEVTLLSVP